MIVDGNAILHNDGRYLCFAESPEAAERIAGLGDALQKLCDLIDRVDEECGVLSPAEIKAVAEARLLVDL